MLKISKKFKKLTAAGCSLALAGALFTPIGAMAVEKPEAKTDRIIFTLTSHTNHEAEGEVINAGIGGINHTYLTEHNNTPFYRHKSYSWTNSILLNNNDIKEDLELLQEQFKVTSEDTSDKNIAIIRTEEGFTTMYFDECNYSVKYHTQEPSQIILFNDGTTYNVNACDCLLVESGQQITVAPETLDQYGLEETNQNNKVYKK